MTLNPSEIGAISSATTITLIAIVLRPRRRRPEGIGRPLSAVTDQLQRAVDKVRSTRRRRRSVPPEDVADWCDQLARRMRSGSTLRNALTSVTPSSSALSHATETLRLGLERGQPIPDALDTTQPISAGRESLRRGPHVDLAFAVIAIAARLGGSNATALDRAAASLRVLAADRQERRAQAAQARLSAHVLTVVPLAMLSLLLLLDSDVRATLRAPVGAACIAAGLLLNGVGWKWMRHIIGAKQ